MLYWKTAYVQSSRPVAIYCLQYNAVHSVNHCVSCQWVRTSLPLLFFWVFPQYCQRSRLCCSSLNRDNHEKSTTYTLITLELYKTWCTLKQSSKNPTSTRQLPRLDCLKVFFLFKMWGNSPGGVDLPIMLTDLKAGVWNFVSPSTWHMKQMPHYDAHVQLFLRARICRDVFCPMSMRIKPCNSLAYKFGLIKYINTLYRWNKWNHLRAILNVSLFKILLTSNQIWSL